MKVVRNGSQQGLYVIEICNRNTRSYAQGPQQRGAQIAVLIDERIVTNQIRNVLIFWADLCILRK